jgi:hypothetical protein
VHVRTATDEQRWAGVVVHVHTVTDEHVLYFMRMRAIFFNASTCTWSNIYRSLMVNSCFLDQSMQVIFLTHTHTK